MNQIFKVVWSKTKRCYVVTSELAKNHTKSNQVKSEAASKRGWLSVFGGIDWSSAAARAVMAALVVTGALGVSTGVSAADGTANQNPTGEHFVSVNYGTYKPGDPTLPGYARVIYNDYVDTFTEYQKKLISNAYAGTTIDSAQNTAYVKKLNTYAQKLGEKGVPLDTINSSGVNKSPLFTTEYNTDGTIKNVTTDLKTLVTKYRASMNPTIAISAVSTAQNSASSLANYSVVKDYVDTYAGYQTQWIRAAYTGDTVGSQATTDQITRLNELRTALFNSGLTQQDIDGLEINKIAGITQSVKNNQIDSINVDFAQLVREYDGTNESYATNDVTNGGKADKGKATNLLGQFFPDTSNYNNDLAKGQNSIAVGLRASTSDKADNSVAIGVDAYAGASDVVAIGNTATSESANSIAIGKNISIDSNVKSSVYKPTNTIAIGMGIKLSGNVYGSVVIGGPAEKSDKVFTSVENNGKNHAGYSVAIGAGARVANYLLGSNAKYANGNSIGGDGGGVAVGPRVWATGQATAMGNDTYALGGSSIAIGSDDNPSVYSSRISAYDGIHYYYQLYRSIIDQAVDNGENMTNKDNNKNGFYLDKAGNMVRFSGNDRDDRAKYSPTMARGVGSIAIGSRSIAYADGSNAFGTVAQALADGATAFGTKTRAEGKSSMSMGNNSQVFANNAIVAGSDSQVFSQGGNAYGYRVYASGQNSLAIGSDAYANASMVFLSDSTGKPVFSKDGAYNEDPAKAATSILSNNTDITSKFDSLLANNSKKSLQSTPTAKDSVSSTDAGLKYAHVNVATRYHGLEKVVARQAGSENVSINDIMYDKDGKVTTDVGVAVKVEDAKYNASLYKNNAIAIGSSAIAQGDNGVSLGHGAIGLGDNSMAIGTYSMTTGNNSVAFGLASRAAGDNTLAMGTAAASMGKNALAVGIGAINYGDNSTVMGYTTGIGEGSKNSITIGAETMIGSGITDSLVIGTGSSIGKYAVVSGDSKGNTSGVNRIYAVDTKTGKVMTDGKALSSLKGLEAEKISGAMAIGVDSRVYSRYGGKETINGEDGTPVEVEINPGETGNNAMAIGNNAQAWLDNSLALGNESKTDYTLEWLNAPAYVTPNAVAVSTDGRTGVISVGSIGNERRIVNVAAGSRDTDAVNVSQLKQMWGTVQRELDPTDRNKSVHFLATNYHPTSKGNSSPDYSSLYSKQVAYQRYVKYATEYKSYLVQEAYGGPGLTEGARASYTKELSDLKQELSGLGYDVAETAIDKFDVSGITNLNTMSDEDKQAAKQAFKTAHGDNPEEVLKGLIKLSEEDTKKLDNGEILKTASMQTGLTPDTLAEKLTLINHDNTQGLTNGSIAVGYNARVGMKDDTDVVSGQEGGIAIGHMARNYATKNVEVDGYSAGSIALGDKSLVLESDLGTKDKDTDTIKVQPGVYYKTTSDFNKASVIASPNAGVVSVGASADKSEEWGGEWKQSTRRIINVAAGANDTDAVNVSQLKSLAEQTITLVANGKTTKGATGSAETKADTTTKDFAIGGDKAGNGTTFKLLGANDGFDITTTASTAGEGNTVNFALNKATEVTAGNNHVVTSDAVYKAIENVNTDVTNLTNGLAGNMVYTDKDGNRVVKDGDNFYTSSSLDGAKKANDGTYYNTTTLESNGFTIDGKGVIVNKDGSPIDTTKEGVAEALDKAKADAAVKQVANGDIVISAVNADGSTTSPTTINNVQSNLASATKNLSADATDDEKKAEANRVAEIATKAMTGDSDATDALGKSGLINATGDVLNNAATLGDLQTVAQAGLTFQTNDLAEEGNDAGKVQKIHKTLGETLNIEGKDGVAFDGKTYSADNLVTTVDTVINAGKTTSQVIRIAMKNTPNLEGVNVQNVTYKDGEKVVNGGVTITATPEKDEDGQSSATNGMTINLAGNDGKEGTPGKAGDGNVRISGVADGKADNDAVNVSQLNDLKTIINGNPGTEAPKGEAGPSGKDGLNGQNMGAQITAIREGTAGTMVYTVTNSDGKQERVTAEGNQYYKNSDLNLTDYTKAVDGKWYKVSEVDPKTGLPNDNAEAVDFAKDVVKSDDKGNKLSPVDAKDIHISAVNAAGDVTGPTTISNVQSNLASAEKDLNAGKDAETVAEIATKAMTGNPAATDALGKSGLINATGDVLNNAATLGDLQTVAQAGLTFQTNNLAEEGNDAGKVQTIHKTLGETLSIIGDENAKYLTKEDVTAPGTTTEGDTSSTADTSQPKPPAITYSSDNLVTTKTGKGAIQIAMKDVPNFDGIHVGKATFTFTPSGNDNKDLRFTVIPDDKNVYGAVVDGIRTGDNYTSAVNKGYVDAKINGTAAINAFQPTLQSRPESADGWNDSGVGIQIQALRNGVAGPVVYTDASGNRAIMVTDAADTNNPTAQKIVKLDSLNGYKLALDKSGNPVGWYRADADIWEKERVEATGEYVATNRISTEAKPEVVAEAVKKFAEDEYVKDKVVLSLVQTNGATDAKIALRNLASDITFTPSTETDEAKKELADAKALTKALVDTETDSNTLTSAATLQDLRAVAKAGLTFETNDGVDKSIHKTLGETLNIEGQKGATFNGEKHSADNLVTTNDAGTIRIAMLKQPTLEGLKLETKEKKTNEDGTSTDVTHTVIMTPTTDGGTTALTLNNGKTSTDGSPVDTRVRISNVANGTAPNDAVNYSQLENLDNQVKELQNGENGPMVYTDGEGNRVVKDGDNFYKASDLVTKDGTHYDVSNLPEGAKLSEDGSAIVNSNGEPISQEDLTKAKDAARVDSSKIQVSAVDPKTGEPAAPTTIGNVKSNYGYNGIGTEADGKTPAKGIANTITPEDAKTAMNGITGADGKVIKEGLLTAKGADLNKVVTVGDLQAAAQAGLDFTGNSKTKGKVDTAHTTLGGTIAIQGGAEYKESEFSDKNISTKVDPKTNTISINIKKNPEFDSVILGQPGENGQPDKQVTISTANGNEVNFTSTHPQDGDTNVVLSGIKDDPARRDTAITRGALEDLGILKGEVGPRQIAGSDVGGNLSNGDNLNDYSLTKQVQAQREGLSGNVVYTDAKGNRLVKAGNKFYSAAPLNKYILESKLRQDPLTGMWFNISDFDEDNKVKEDAKGNGLTAEQLAKKAGVSETQVSDIKLSAVNMSGDTNTPTEIGNIKSTIGLNKEAKVDASGEAVYVGGPIEADAAKKAVVVTDDKGNVTGGLLNVSGSQLNTVATVGDLQAVAQAGLDFKANNNSDGTKNPLHRTLGSEISIKGADVNDGKTFAPDTLPNDKTINDYAFNANNIMTQVQGNVIRIGMKSAPEFTGVNLISANQPTLRLENKDGHLMLTEVKGDVVQSSVRLATQNDGFYIKDANGNKTLVRINNEDAIEFNKYLTVTKADPKSDDTSATGNTGTTGSTGSGTSTGENVNAGTTTGGNTTGGNTSGASTSDTTPKAVGTVDVVVKDVPTEAGDIANKKYVDKQIGDIIKNFNTKNELEGQGTIATNTSTDKLAVSGVTVKQYLDDNYMTRPEINRRFTEVSKQANAGTAAAMAAAGIPQVTNMYDDNLMIGAGVGSYGGESAVAIGVSGTNDDRDITYKVAATYDSRGKWGLSGGIGFSVGSGRDNPTKPERKTISERVDRLTAENKQLNDRNSQLEAQMKAISDKNDRLEKEMQEMKAMFRQMMPQMQKANGQAASNEDGTKEEQKITATA